MSDRSPLADPGYRPDSPYAGAGADPGPFAGGGPAKRDGLRVEPPARGARRRMPELILGIFLIAACGLAAVLLAVSGRSRSDAVALSVDVERGTVIAEEHLTTAQVGTDGDVAYMSPSETDVLLGQVASTDLEAGALLTPGLVSDPVELLDSDGMVGLVVGPGELPMLTPAAGDVVNVIASAQGSTEGEFVAQAQIVEIHPVDDSSQEERWHISLRAPETQADRLAMALAGQGQIKLVLVGE